MGEDRKAFAFPSIIGDDGLERDLAGLEEKLWRSCIYIEYRIKNNEGRRRTNIRPSR